MLSQRAQRRETAAMQAHAHAMRKGMSWRHALRDALEASDAAIAGRVWQCPTCFARYDPKTTSALRQWIAAPEFDRRAGDHAERWRSVSTPPSRSAG